MRRAALSLCAALTFWAPAPPALSQQGGGDEVVLSLPQMRVAAMRAVSAGQYEIAINLAHAMLAAHPDDSFSHFVIAQAFLRNGQPTEARPAAKLSYRLADTPVQRHEAARLAALSEAMDERFLPAQFWLRRAVQAAPDEKMRARTVREFRAARRAAKLHLTFGLSVAPSSNVNGGASEELNVVDGVPLVGILSPDAQALSGYVAQGDLRARYRLRRSEWSQTQLHGALQVRRVTLSDEARDKAPNAKGSTYNSTLFDFGLSHTQKLNEAGTLLTGGGFLGRTWYGGDPAYDYGRASLTLSQPLGDRTSLSFGGLYREQWNDGGPYADVETTGWQAGVTHYLTNDDRLSLSLARSESLSDNTQQTSDGDTLSLGYARAEPVGPVRISAAFSATRKAYPDYRVFIPVPGGREDTEYGATLDLTLHDFDYYGFVPNVRLQAERTDSNVSRFDTETFSISIGFESAF
ncbi:surface lipoprotein assembly modifier [Thalassococcus profundi]|uniref:surface lipoprotein assembly modifier n=1 Tax=Thalassococcus profundi TaxID=2282382 RepID=UPI004059DD91